MTTLAEIMGYAAARVNLLPWGHSYTASNFNDAGFNETARVTIGAGITALDGTSTAQKVIENTDTNTHRVGSGWPDLQATTPTIMRRAVIAKADERTRIVVSILNFSVANADISIGFDLAGGNVGHDSTVGSSVTLSAAMTDLGGGWWLCYFDWYLNSAVTYDVTSGPVISNFVFLDSGSGTAARSISYAGDGSSGLYIWVDSLLPKGIWELNTRLFHDDFTSTSTIDLTNSREAGFNWYLHNLMPDSSMPTFGWHTNPPSAPTLPGNISVTDGVLKIWNPSVSQTGWRSQLWSVVTDGNGGYRGQVFRAPMMWECYISEEDAHDAGWGGVPGTFWGSSIEALVNRGLNPSRHFMEWDVYESGVYGGSDDVGSWTVHDWYDPSSPSHQAFASGARIADTVTPGVTFHRINGVWLNEAYSGNGYGTFWAFNNGMGCGFQGEQATVNVADGAYHLATYGGQADGHSLPVFINTAEQTTGSGSGARYWVDYVSVYGVEEPPTRWAFWNVFDKGSDITVSTPTALILSKTAGTDWATSRAHIGKSTGKWYWELTLAGDSGSIDHANGVMLGIVNFDATLNTYPGQNNMGAGLQYNTAANTNISGVIGDPRSMTWVAGDIIGFAFDADNGKVFIHKNGSWLTGTPAGGFAVWSGLSSEEEWYPAGAIKSASVNITITANFGVSDFAYAVPSGFSGLSHESPAAPSTEETPAPEVTWPLTRRKKKKKPVVDAAYREAVYLEMDGPPPPMPTHDEVFDALGGVLDNDDAMTETLDKIARLDDREMDDIEAALMNLQKMSRYAGSKVNKARAHRRLMKDAERLKATRSLRSAERRLLQ